MDVSIPEKQEKVASITPSFDILSIKIIVDTALEDSNRAALKEKYPADADNATDEQMIIFSVFKDKQKPANFQLLDDITTTALKDGRKNLKVFPDAFPKGINLDIWDTKLVIALYQMMVNEGVNFPNPKPGPDEK